MNIYDTAVMLAGQFVLTLILDPNVKRGRIILVPDGDRSGVFLNPADKPRSVCSA